MTRLFDVNALIGMIDPGHAFHQPMHTWLQRHKGARWATCPITENGFVRVISQPGYPGIRLTTGGAIKTLSEMKRASGSRHEFWADDYSITEVSSVSDDLVKGHQQVTDIYLVALALRKGGRFLTFDNKVAWQCVPGATASIIEVPPA